MLSVQLDTSTQLEVLDPDRNWNKVCATKKGKVFPMVVASLAKALCVTNFGIKLGYFDGDGDGDGANCKLEERNEPR